MTQIAIPSLLRPLCDNAREIEVPGGSLESILRAADEQCPGFYDRVVDVEENRVRIELAIALNGEIVTLYLHQHIPDNANIAIVPALAGG